MCDDRKNNNNNSLFIMGLIIGAIIASAVVLISAEDKAKIIKKIKNKFNDFFDDNVINHVSTKTKKIIKKTNKIIANKIVKPIQKISVTLPKDIESLNLTPIKTAKPKMVFKKSK